MMFRWQSSGASEARADPAENRPKNGAATMRGLCRRISSAASKIIGVVLAGIAGLFSSKIDAKVSVPAEASSIEDLKRRLRTGRLAAGTGV